MNLVAPISAFCSTFTDAIGKATAVRFSKLPLSPANELRAFGGGEGVGSPRDQGSTMGDLRSPFFCGSISG